MSRSSSRAIFSFGILTLAAALTPACASQSQPASAGDASTSTTETESAAQPTTPTETQPGSTTPGTTPGTTTPGTTGPTTACNPDKEPNREYRMRDSAQCKAALFQCPTGSKGFTNECGCGCEKL